MTTGESLLTIAIIGGLIYGIYFISKKKKWKLILKIAVGLIIVSVLVSAGVYGYFQIKNRPTEINQLGKLVLGMSPVEVTLAMGEPTQQVEGLDGDFNKRYIYADYTENIEYYIKFSDTDPEILLTACHYDIYSDLFGIGKYDDESVLEKKLGKSQVVSINEKGLKKIVTYPRWNVAYEITQGDISAVCITTEDELRYLTEFTSS